MEAPTGLGLVPRVQMVADREATSASPAQAPRLRPRARLLRHPLIIGILFTCGAGAATASSLWLAPAGNHRYGFNPGLSQTAPPAAQLAALAVLRRPQSEADRVRSVQAALADVNNFTAGVRSNYVRVLERTHDGLVVLVPVQRWNASAPATGVRTRIRDALCVYYPFGRPGSLNNNTHCWDLQQVTAGQALAAIGGHEYGLVPDGVLSVRVAIGSRTKSARVTGNFFDVTLPNAGAPAGRPAIPVSPTVTFSR
ncbi:MAG: hypothetical protein ACRDLP_07060 [Solirubrobacteraceae bacterium]